jgi:HAD superfamily hydrolase (TIGR01484 family)
MQTSTPPPWARCPAHRLTSVLGVLTDIDDTLTREGTIEPAALAALTRAQAAGLPVIAVTGRPMGWSRPFAAAWPVAAIVAENGSVMLWRDAEASARDGEAAVTVAYSQSAETRQAHAQRLQRCAQTILAALPQARLATDSPGRVTDIAIDHSEHHHLSADDVARVVALMRADGLTATVSSIHVNGWIGDHDKWSGACWAVRERLGRALPAEVSRWVYVGDSANDQRMFGCVPLSVGVANLMACAAQLHTWPAYLTQAERGAGFAEVVDAVLAARRATHAA